MSFRSWSSMLRIGSTWPYEGSGRWKRAWMRTPPQLARRIGPPKIERLPVPAAESRAPPSRSHGPSAPSPTARSTMSETYRPPLTSPSTIRRGCERGWPSSLSDMSRPATEANLCLLFSGSLKYVARHVDDAAELRVADVVHTHFNVLAVGATVAEVRSMVRRQPAPADGAASRRWALRGLAHPPRS